MQLLSTCYVRIAGNDVFVDVEQVNVEFASPQPSFEQVIRIVIMSARGLDFLARASFVDVILNEH